MTEEHVVDELLIMEMRFNLALSRLSGGMILAWRGASTKLVLENFFSKEDFTKKLAYEEHPFKHLN